VPSKLAASAIFWLVGGLLLVTGIALIHGPAALIVAGLLLLGVGLLVARQP